MLSRSVPTRILSKEEISKYTATTGAILLTSSVGITLDQGNQTIVVGSDAITMNAGIAAGNTVMTLAASNGSVGIGTTTPSQKLHINPGTVLLDGSVPKLYMKDTNYGLWYSSTANPFSASFPTNGLAVVGLVDGALGTNDPANGGSKSIVTWNSSGKVAINTPLTSSMSNGLTVDGNIILNNGKLGVGTASPSSVIEIQSVVGTPGFCMIGDTNGPRLMLSSSLRYGNVIVANNNNSVQQSVMAWDQSQTTTSLLINNIYFSAGGTEQLRIAGSGAIGISTNSPLGRLHVALDASTVPSAWDTTQLIVGALTQYSGGLSFSYNSLAGMGYVSCFQPGISKTIAYKNIQYSGLNHLFYSCGSSYGLTTPALSVTTVSSSSTGIAAVGVGTTSPPGTLSVQLNSSPSLPWGFTATGWDPNTVVFGKLSGANQGGLNFSYHQAYTKGYGYLAMGGPAQWAPLAYGARDHYFYTNCGTSSVPGSVNSILFGQETTMLPTPIMVISNNGGVGIGTTSPNGLFHIISPSQTYTTTPPSASNYILNISGNDCYYSGTSACYSRSINLDTPNLVYPNSTNPIVTAYGSQIIINGGGLSSNPVTAVHGSIQFLTGNSLERMRVDGMTGFVGIGTTAPDCPLTVYSNVTTSGIFPSASQYFSRTTSGFVSTSINSIIPSISPSEMNSISIKTNKSLYCGGVVAASDVRIKRDIEPLSYGLDTLLTIRPTQYHFVDHIEQPNKDIGVIAQEIKQIIPQAVTETTDFIPDVFKSVRVTKVEKFQVTVQLEERISWKVHDTVRVISKEHGKQEATVLSVSDSECCIVMDIEIKDTELFLWGKKVYDFLTVDYTKLIPVLIQSVQESYQKFYRYKIETDNRIAYLEQLNRKE